MITSKPDFMKLSRIFGKNSSNFELPKVWQVARNGILIDTLGM